MPLVSANKFVACVVSAHQSVSDGPTDMCKTPAPPAPVPPPLPYPNISMSSTPGAGFTTKTLSTATPMWTTNGETMLSNGDQPGVMMGLISSKIMAPAGIIMASNDVDAEGGGVVRTLDSSASNG